MRLKATVLALALASCGDAADQTGTDAGSGETNSQRRASAGPGDSGPGDPGAAESREPTPEQAAQYLRVHYARECLNQPGALGRFRIGHLRPSPTRDEVDQWMRAEIHSNFSASIIQNDFDPATGAGQGYQRVNWTRNTQFGPAVIQTTVHRGVSDMFSAEGCIGFPDPIVRDITSSPYMPEAYVITYNLIHGVLDDIWITYPPRIGYGSVSLNQPDPARLYSAQVRRFDDGTIHLSVN